MSYYSEGVEAVGSKYRTSIGSLYSVFFSLGSATLGLIGYFIRDWRTLQLAISIPIFIPTALYWYNSSIRFDHITTL